MATVRSCEFPVGALLATYRERSAYTECYVTEVRAPVTQAQYVEAFHTTPLFRMERLVLAWLMLHPSTDLQARQLASGEIVEFAAWKVELRGVNQLLLTDFHSPTRSWLMTVPDSANPASGTTLYFSSAVVPAIGWRTGRQTMGLAFRALVGFRKLYSRALLPLDWTASGIRGRSH